MYKWSKKIKLIGLTIILCINSTIIFGNPAASSSNEQLAVRIIPTPKKMILSNKNIDLRQYKYLSAPKRVLDLFMDECGVISDTYKQSLKTTTLKDDKLIFVISKTSVKDYKLVSPAVLKQEQAYTLDITEKSIIIHGSDESGLFFGLQTLLSLMEENNLAQIPALHIEDYPLIKNRSIIIRNIGKKMMKKLVRRIARCKYNDIYFLIKGGFEVKCAPKYFAGKIKQADIAEIINLAHKNNINVYPVLNALCGFNYFPARPELEKNLLPLLEPPLKTAPHWIKKKRKTKKGIKRTFKMRNEKVYKLYFAVADEIWNLFGKPRIFHIGCDEGWDFGASGYPVSNKELLAEHINRIYSHFAAKGVKVVIWGDTLFSRGAYKDHLNLHGQAPWNTAGAADLLNKDIIIASWHYRPLKDFPPIRDLTQKGFRVIGVSWKSPVNVLNMAKSVQKYKAYGTMASTWSIHVPRRVSRSKDTGVVKYFTREYEVIPWTAEAAWSPDKAEKIIGTYDAYELMNRYLSKTDIKSEKK